MTIAGWIVMCLSVGSVTSLLSWCLYQVLFKSHDKKLHGIDVDTHGD
jgi:hypothetical protein